MQPAPFVVQVEITALQDESDVSVTGRRAHVKGTQVVVEAFHPQVNVEEPAMGVLLHSEAVVKPPQVKGFVLH